MPYIYSNDRTEFDYLINQISSLISDDGKLNFVLSSICGSVLLNRGVRYQNYNNIIGAIESAKLEFARMFAPYEDVKIKENGDVMQFAMIRAQF